MPERGFRVAGIYDLERAEVSAPTTIVVDGDRVVALDSDGHRGVPTDDFSDAIAMTGLIDSHTHLSIATPGDERAQVARPAEERVLRALAYADAMLAEGVTAIRILGEPAWFDLHLRDAFAAGLWRGPRLFCAGRIVAPRHAVVSVVDAPADGSAVVERVRENLARRANWIKVYATPSSLHGNATEAYFSAEEIRMVVETAHRAGVPVAAHAHGGQAVDDLVAAGVDTIEHGRYLSDAQLEAMARRGTVLCSTVGIGVFADVARSGRPVDDALRVSDQSVAAALEAGVTVVPGTDAVHGQLRFELSALEHYGASREDALRAATTTAARVVAPHADLGRIAPGARADFTLLDGDPRAGATIPRAVATCVGGSVVWRATDRATAGVYA